MDNMCGGSGENLSQRFSMDRKQRDRYIRREPSSGAPGKPEVIVSKHTGKVLGRFANKKAAEKGWGKTMKRIHSGEHYS